MPCQHRPHRQKPFLTSIQHVHLLQRIRRFLLHNSGKGGEQCLCLIDKETDTPQSKVSASWQALIPHCSTSTRLSIVLHCLGESRVVDKAACFVRHPDLFEQRLVLFFGRTSVSDKWNKMNHMRAVTALSHHRQIIPNLRSKKMRIIPFVFVVARLALSLPTSEDSSADSENVPIDTDFDILNSTIADAASLDKRAVLKYTVCANPIFEKPCTRVEVAGLNACQKIPFTEGTKYRDFSFSPDKGVSCKVFSGNNCEDMWAWMGIDKGMDDVMRTAKSKGLFKGSVAPGFYSVRCWVTRTK